VALYALKINPKAIPPVQVKGRVLSIQPAILTGKDDESHLLSDMNRFVYPRPKEFMYSSDDYDEDCLYKFDIPGMKTSAFEDGCKSPVIE